MGILNRCTKRPPNYDGIPWCNEDGTRTYQTIGGDEITKCSGSGRKLTMDEKSLVLLTVPTRMENGIRVNGIEADPTIDDVYNEKAEIGMVIRQEEVFSYLNGCGDTSLSMDSWVERISKRKIIFGLAELTRKL